MLIEVISYSYISKGHALEIIYEKLNSFAFSVSFIPVNSQITSLWDEVTFINRLCYTYWSSLALGTVLTENYFDGFSVGFRIKLWSRPLFMDFLEYRPFFVGWRLLMKALVYLLVFAQCPKQGCFVSVLVRQYSMLLTTNFGGLLLCKCQEQAGILMGLGVSF